MELDDLEKRLDAAAARLARSAAHLSSLHPGARTFGADGPGRLGDIGRAMSAQFAGALDARDRQAGSAAAAVSDLATGVRHAAAGYRQADSNRGKRPRGADS
jgi:Excreted virulence factor EspC, type VII ESX diderm